MTTERKNIHEIKITNGPKQYAFDKRARANGDPVIFTLLFDKQGKTGEWEIEAVIETSSVPFERILNLFGYLKNSGITDDLKQYLELDKNESKIWNIYFTARYDIQTCKGMMYPFLINVREAQLAHQDIELRPANHPFNSNSIGILLPNELSIIIEHGNNLAVKKAVAEALSNTKKPESRPNDEPVCNRVSALKIIIANCNQGDELAKKIIFQLLNQTCNLTKPVGLLFPSNCVAFGNSVLNKVKIILEHVCWETYIAPYTVRVDFEKGSLIIADSITNPNSPIEFQTLDMTLLNEISKIVW